MTEPQLQAYLIWARERGLRFPRIRPAEAKPPVPPSTATPRGDAATVLPPLPSRDPVADPCFGYGGAQVRALFLGDGAAPAAYAAASAFAGAERALLDKMIAAMRLGPTDVYVTNAVPQCPPRDDVILDAAEAAACRARLRAMVTALHPQIVVVLGAWTLKLLLGERALFQELCGRVLPPAALGVPVLATYHPRELLSLPSNKRQAWTDLQVVMAELGLKEP